MNLNDLKKIRKKLEEEYNENCSKIDELDDKIRVISANNFETKVNYALAFSMIPWVVSIFFMPAMVKSGIIPLNMVQPLSVGVPALVGIIGEELLAKKLKWRERLRKFSKAKTQKEKLAESTKYEIEKEKLISANKILKKNYDDLLANERLINSLSTSYNITEKDVDERSKEEISNSIENTNNILQKKQQEVDIATTKSFLKEKFWKARDKAFRFTDVFMFGMMGGMGFMLFCDMPIICLNQLENIQFQASFFGILAPAVIGGLFGSGYLIKRTHDYISVFKTLNNQLGDNAISEIRDYEEDEQFAKNLENVITDTSAIKLKLESEKQKLNHVCETTSEIQMQSEVENLPMNYAKNETPLENMMPYMEESIFEEQSQEQGLVLKRDKNLNKK